MCVSAIKWQTATAALQAKKCVPVMFSNLNQHFDGTPL